MTLLSNEALMVLISNLENISQQSAFKSCYWYSLVEDRNKLHWNFAIDSMVSIVVNYTKLYDW